jgi:hypothetical protein
MDRGETMSDIICARCGKRLKNPVWIGGKPYGKTCAKNLGKPLTTTKSTKSTGRSGKKQNRKVEHTESLDAFLAQPIIVE